MTNFLSITAFVLCCLLLNINAQAQTCEIYFPCQPRTLTYSVYKIGSSSIDFGNENIVITSVNNNAINFNRTVSTTTLQSGGEAIEINSMPRQGSIDLSTEHMQLPGEAYVPGLPLSMAVNLFSPPPTIVEDMGSGCYIPLNPTLNQMLPECTSMGMEAISTFSFAGGGSSNTSLGGQHTFEWNATHTNRQVLSINETIQLQINGENTPFEAMVIAERVVRDGTSFKGSQWEISWWVKGYGVVRTYIFENEDNSTNIPPSWNNPSINVDGYIGFRRLDNP